MSPMSHPHRPLWRYTWLKLSYGVLGGMAIVLILGMLSFL